MRRVHSLLKSSDKKGLHPWPTFNGQCRKKCCWGLLFIYLFTALNPRGINFPPCCLERNSSHPEKHRCLFFCARTVPNESVYFERARLPFYEISPPIAESSLQFKRGLRLFKNEALQNPLSRILKSRKIQNLQKIHLKLF